MNRHHIVGLGLLSAWSLGCQAAVSAEPVGPNDPPRVIPARGGPSAARAAADPSMRRLLGRRAELERQLAAVERKLLATEPGRAQGSSKGGAGESLDEEELVERRLVLHVALVQAGRSVRRRQLELGYDGPALEPAGDDAPPAIAEALQQAEQELERARVRLATADPGAAIGQSDRGWANEAPLDGLLGGEDLRAQAPAPGPRPKPRRRRGRRGKGGPAKGFEPDRSEGRDATAGLDVPDLKPDEKKKERRADDEHGGRKAAVVAHGAPPAGVMSAVRQRLPQLESCFPSELRQAGPVRLKVRAQLASDGALRRPSIASSVGLPARVQACLADQLGLVRAPASEDGSSRMIVFPLWLSGEP